MDFREQPGGMMVAVDTVTRDELEEFAAKEVTSVPESPNPEDIFLEIGKKKVFAGAVYWPGWCRQGKDEATALKALFAAAPRYQQVLQTMQLDFDLPEKVTAFTVGERVQGNTTTDFGAPDALLSGDEDRVEENESQRFGTILQASWYAFDEAVRMAEGQELRKGPRGGGRDLQKMIQHVVGSEEAYLQRLGWKMEKAAREIQERMLRTREGVLKGLEAAARGDLSKRGPRGGKRWTARFFVRRVTWHVLDHAWEIEDRMTSNGV